MRVPIGWRQYAVKWGDGITIELRPLSKAAMHDCADYFQQRPEKTVFTLSDVMDVHDLAGKIFPGHVQNLRGLEDEDGKLITPEQVCDGGIFSVLASEIVHALMQISQLSGEERKNLNGPATTPEAEATAPGLS